MKENLMEVDRAKEAYTYVNISTLEKLGMQIERLQEQLKEANDIIISIAVMPRFPINPELCREYLEKWGVK